MRRRLSVFSRTYSVVAPITLLFAGLVACGQAPSVDLKNSGVRPPDSARLPDAKPGDGDHGNGGDDGEPGSTTPVGAPPVPRYRMVCEFPIRDWMASFTSRALPSDRVSLLSVSEIPAAKNGGQTEVKPEDANLESFSQIVALKTSGLDGLSLLHSARRSDRGFEQDRIFLTKMDLLYRIGHATALGPVVTPSMEASILAHELGLRLRSHGAARSAESVIVPDGATMKVVDASSLEKLGALKLDPRTHFFPALDDVAGIYSVLQYEEKSAAFRNAFMLAPGAEGRPVWLEVETAPPPGYTAAGPSVARGDRSFWIEVKKGSKLSRELLVVSLDRARLKLERIRFEAPPGYVVAPMAAFLAGPNEGFVALALEKIEVTAPKPGRTHGAKVHDAQIAIYRIEGGKLLVHSEISYPLETVSAVEAMGLEDRPIVIRSLLASPDGRELYAVMPGRISTFLYRFQGTEVERLTQEYCSSPSIVKVSE